MLIFMKNNIKKNKTAHSSGHNEKKNKTCMLLHYALFYLRLKIISGKSMKSQRGTVDQQNKNELHEVKHNNSSEMLLYLQSVIGGFVPAHFVSDRRQQTVVRHDRLQVDTHHCSLCTLIIYFVCLLEIKTKLPLFQCFAGENIQFHT